MEDESLGHSVGRHVWEKLKAGFRDNTDDAAFTPGDHCFAKSMGKSDEYLDIELNFSLYLR